MLRPGPKQRLTKVVRGPAHRSVLGLVCSLGLASASCFKPDDGREPPLDRIYFPTGLALSTDGNRLYVANSDWDLQFNAGSVQAYDAAQLRARLPAYCDTDLDCAEAGQVCDLPAPTDGAALGATGTHWCVDASTRDVCRGNGVQSPGDRAIQPGLCGPIDNRAPDLLLGSVSIGSFATDLLYRENPAGGGGRLLAPVRSDATLHWIDTNPSVRELECGQGANGKCDANHRRGDGVNEETPTGVNLPIEPFGIAANLDGAVNAIVVTHQTEGELSLFTDDWNDPGSGPQLQFVLDQLALLPIYASAIPIPGIAKLERQQRDPNQTQPSNYQPGFWVAFRGAPFVALVRYFDRLDASDGNPFLQLAFADAINPTANSDIHGIAVDDSRRASCDASCAPDDVACLSNCSGIALDVFLANRAPPSVLVGSTNSPRRADPSNDRLQMSDLVAVDDGASRITIGSIRDQNGLPQRRVFLTSFDSSSVTIYDPVARLIEARVLTGRGPTALAIDDANAIAYVAHFTDSYVGVIDLDIRHSTFGTEILSLGKATAPRGDDR